MSETPDQLEEDIMLKLCIEQGYVPAKCQLKGQIVYFLVQSEGDPCARCNMDRHVCGGRPRHSDRN